MYALLLLALGWWTMLGSTAATAQAIPRAEAGVIDLRNWNPESDGTVVLKGNWNFYWSQLLGPDDFVEGRQLESKDSIRVPGGWVQVKGYPEKGYATYHLRVLAPDIREYSIRFSQILTASRIYVDGRLLVENGKVGTRDDPAVYQVGVLDEYYVFTPKNPTFDIVVQVASYEFFIAGMIGAPTIGERKAIIQGIKLDIVISSMLAGLLVVMGIYHFCLYALRTKAKSTLYFGSICLTCAGYMLASRGQVYLILFPDLSFTWWLRMFNLWVAGMPFLAFYTYELFPKQFNKRIAQLLGVICWTFYAYILISEPREFVNLTQVIHVCALILALYIFYVMFRAVKQREDGVLLFIAGASIFILSSLHDVVMSSGYFESIPLGAPGLSGFIIFQSFLLAKRFSKAFKQVEVSEREVRILSEDLRVQRDHVINLNTNLEQIVEEQTREIRSIMEHIKLGIFTITQESLRIHKDYSVHLEEIFEVAKLANRDALELLIRGSNLSSDECHQVGQALHASLGEVALAFDMNQHALPHEIRRKRSDGQERILDLSWNPIIDSHGIVDKILVTVRDVTELKALEEEAQDKKEELLFIGELLNVPPDTFRRFLQSCQEFIAENRKLINSQSVKRRDLEVLKVLFINMHTMKGAARSLYFKKMTQIFHDVEQYYALLQKDPDVKWDIIRMNHDLDAVEAIVRTYSTINKDKLGRRHDEGREILFSDQEISRIYHQILSLDKLCRGQLDERSLEIILRLEESFFPHLYASAQSVLEDVCRSVSTLAKDLEKAKPKVHINAEGLYLTAEGEDLLRKIFVHILRNSLDHGIEKQQVRLNTGKSEEGLIQIHMVQTGESIQLSYADDGRGLQFERIRRSAIDRRLITPETKLDAATLAELIFHNGLTTASQVSDISGRGVGMGAVKRYLEEFGGRIRIELHPERQKGHEGCPFTFVIELPFRLFGTKESAASNIPIAS